MTHFETGIEVISMLYKLYNILNSFIKHNSCIKLNIKHSKFKEKFQELENYIIVTGSQEKLFIKL